MDQNAETYSNEKNRKKNQSTARRAFRKKLESWGMDPEEIKKCVEQMKFRQREKMYGHIPLDAPLCTRAAYIKELRKRQAYSAPHLKLGDDYETPEDKDYRPVAVDALLKGEARATGVTAKVVRRGKTITKDEYDNLEG